MSQFAWNVKPCREIEAQFERALLHSAARYGNGKSFLKTTDLSFSENSICALGPVPPGFSMHTAGGVLRTGDPHAVGD
jgi:hypothetical protein